MTLTTNEHDLEFKGSPFHTKLLAEALADYIEKNPAIMEEVSETTITDFIFNLEVAYQTYYNLDQDDWGWAGTPRKPVHRFVSPGKF